MAQGTVHQTVSRLVELLEKGGYSPNTIFQFKATTNQLLKFMDSEGICEFNTDVGLAFMKAHYFFDPAAEPSHFNQQRLRDLRKISEFQLYGTTLLKARTRTYYFPKSFCEAADGFVAHRRFEGIVEHNVSVINLYLERFFSYLTAQPVTQIADIDEAHISGFLLFLTGFSDQTKAHMMRTVRQFMGFCFKNGYHPADLSGRVPHVHYERRARIPSAYSYDDIMKLLTQVDRSNPLGKRNYAILLLISRLGLRAGDVTRLTIDSLDWDGNRILLTQRKTGRPLVLPLFEDVGLAIIDFIPTHKKSKPLHANRRSRRIYARLQFGLFSSCNRMDSAEICE